jgi:hypothetical protein
MPNRRVVSMDHDEPDFPKPSLTRNRIVELQQRNSVEPTL